MGANFCGAKSQLWICQIPRAFQKSNICFYTVTPLLWTYPATLAQRLYFLVMLAVYSKSPEPLQKARSPGNREPIYSKNRQQFIRDKNGHQTYSGTSLCYIDHTHPFQWTLQPEALLRWSSSQDTFTSVLNTEQNKTRDPSPSNWFKKQSSMQNYNREKYSMRSVPCTPHSPWAAQWEINTRKQLACRAPAAWHIEPSIF